jgi:hypothetical protein
VPKASRICDVQESLDGNAVGGQLTFITSKNPSHQKGVSDKNQRKPLTQAEAINALTIKLEQALSSPLTIPSIKLSI